MSPTNIAAHRSNAARPCLQRTPKLVDHPPREQQSKRDEAHEGGEIVGIQSDDPLLPVRRHEHGDGEEDEAEADRARHG